MVNSMCEISIVVPVYNAEKTLNRCVDSVLRQSYADFELLLIDDGSTDTSGMLCDEWEKRDERIRVFHQSNAGVSAARNVGIDHAFGKYICFVDSDDWVKIDYLGKLYTSLLPYKESVCLVIHGFIRTNLNGDILPGIKLPDIVLDVSRFDKAFTEYHICKRGYSCSKLYQRDVLNKHNIRFNIHVHCCEDLLFMLEYIYNCEYICWGSAQNYVYTTSEASLSVRINSFESEYACLALYTMNLNKSMTRYSFSPKSVPVMLDLWMVLFERTIKANYFSSVKISMYQRVLDIKSLVNEYYPYICKYYCPAFKIDKIGRFFLIHRFFFLYDLWIGCMLRLGGKHVFLGFD